MNSDGHLLGAWIHRHLPAVAALVQVVLVVLWPLPVASGAIGHPVGDMPDHYWGTWWFGYELLSGRLPTTTDLSNYPQHLALWYVDPVGALLALPLRIFGFPKAWNGMVLIQVLGSTLAAYGVGVAATGRRVPGVVAGVVVGASPYLLGLVHSGLSEYLGLALPLLFVWALIRATGLDPMGRAPPKRASMVAGVLLGASGYQAPYYLVFGAILALCAVPGRGWRSRWGPVGRILGVAAGVTLPLAVVLQHFLDAPNAAVTRDNAPSWQAGIPTTDLLTFVHPGRYYFPDLARAGNPGILHVNYLGWVALLLAFTALVRRSAARRLLPMATIYGVLMLGPYLCIDHHTIVWFGHEVPLPLRLAWFPGSPFTMVHHIYRMVALFLPLLAILAALGAARLPAWLGMGAAVLFVAEALFLSPARWPLPEMDVTPPAIYAKLGPGPVLDWPPDATTWNRRYLVWQVSHHRPIPYGVNVFLPEEVRRDALPFALLASLDNPRKRAVNRDIRAHGQLLLRPTSNDTHLAELGFRYVVLHRRALTPRERARAQKVLRLALGDPVALTSDAEAWRAR